MPRADCLILDDVGAALSMMSELGQGVVRQAAAPIRDAVLEYCLRHEWSLLNYDAYVQWATQQIAADDRKWLVLDPLFPVERLGNRARRIRTTRLFEEHHAIVHRLYADTEFFAGGDELVPKGDIGVLDDAAASGMTLRRIMRYVGDAGGQVTRILVGASSRTARDAFRSGHSRCAWTEFMPGAWRTLHLRDGCPHLPYSGRPTEQGVVHCGDGSFVDVRVPVATLVGHPWQILAMDARVREAVSRARYMIARQLSMHLGRDACVADLPILGVGVPVLVRPGELVTGTATLESLIGA
jgi:hypothetical protein